MSTTLFGKPAPTAGRDHLDRYYTPDGVARACVATVPDLGARVHRLEILEPSCGGGAFLRAIRQRWPDSLVVGLDVDPEAPGFVEVAECGQPQHCDFLDFPHSVDLVLGNPPFKHAEQHVRHALKLARVGVGFLLRLAFLESEARIPFWREFPASKVAILSRRPSFTGGGTDSAAYAFFWWDRRQRVTRTEMIHIWEAK